MNWTLRHRPLVAFTLGLASVFGVSDALAGPAFSKRLEMQGFAFDITATNEGSINKLRIVPQGLSQQTAPITSEIEGTVSGAEIDDLDANGFPEIYIYVTSAGSGSYGRLVGYAVNRGKSVTPIYLPPVSDSPALSQGYRGHD